MNYDYSEPFLEIRFKDGNITRIKRNLITDIYSHKENGENVVKVNFNRGDSSHWYRFDGTMEEFEENSKIVYL